MSSAAGVPTRNRGPCRACQAAKRKCNQGRPQCLRCRQRNIACEPSLQARWRVKTARRASEQQLSGQQTIHAGSSVGMQQTLTPNEDVSGDSQSTIISNTICQDAVQDSPQPPETNPQLIDFALFDEALNFLPSTSETHLTDSDGSTAQPFTFFPWPGFGMDTLPSLLSPQQFCERSSPNTLNEQPLPTGFPAVSDQNTTDASPGVTQSLGKIPIQAQSPSHGLINGQSRITPTLSATINAVLCLADETLPNLSTLESYLLSLWHSFVGKIAPFLTAFGTRQDNPFLKYLVPLAETDPDLLTAILYLTQIIIDRGRQCPLDARGRFLEKRAEVIQQKLQRQEELSPAYSERLVEESNSALITFSTVIVFCMAFLASQDVTKLVSHGELAVLLCQDLFKELAEYEGFLYLVKLLGYILNALLFSSHTGMINAPDYLSAALECQDPDDEAFHQLRGDRDGSDHFRDLDMFSGMSAAMASIMYTLGSLMKRKKAGVQDTLQSGGESLRLFESDVDGLEARLRRRLALISKRRGMHPSSSASQQSSEISISRCLSSFNEALFWSAWTIFWSDLRNQTTDSNPNINGCAERIIDACAEIPKESIVAPLTLFPLIVGGMRMNKKVYREFILSRLRDMENLGLTDTQSCYKDLENWWNSQQSTNKVNALSSIIF